MKSFTTRQLGTKGESHAARYLYELGYEILARNWRCAEGELDLIALDENELVLVEVRTRQGQAALTIAAESITPQKQARLLNLADLYAAEHPHPYAIRIDVVVVAVEGENITLEHYQNAVGW